tara:strand:+ start:1217 stop:1438 length:222 start_codon:yes stop_codon:yes gene_type:complete
MLTQGTGFAKYSRSLCWVVALIWLALSVLAFTGGGASANINGVLWLVGAIAFAVSATVISKDPSEGDSETGED